MVDFLFYDMLCRTLLLEITFCTEVLFTTVTRVNVCTISKNRPLQYFDTT